MNKEVARLLYTLIGGSVEDFDRRWEIINDVRAAGADGISTDALLAKYPAESYASLVDFLEDGVKTGQAEFVGKDVYRLTENAPRPVAS